MRSPRTKATWIERTLIETHFKVALCFAEEDFNFELKRLKVPLNERPEWLSQDADANTHFFEGKGQSQDEKIIIICIKPNNERAMFSLIHEAVHVYQAEIEHIGELHPSDEFMAYAIEAIAENLIKAYLNKAKKTKI